MNFHGRKMMGYENCEEYVNKNGDRAILVFNISTSIILESASWFLNRELSSILRIYYATPIASIARQVTHLLLVG